MLLLHNLYCWLWTNSYCSIFLVVIRIKHLKTIFKLCTIAVIPKELCLWICFVLVWATHDTMNFRHNVQVYPPSLWASLVRYKWVLKWFLHTKCHLINTDNCMQTLRTKASNVKHDNSTNKINIFKF